MVDEKVNEGKNLLLLTLFSRKSTFFYRLNKIDNRNILKITDIILLRFTRSNNNNNNNYFSPLNNYIFAIFNVKKMNIKYNKTKHF